MFKEHRLIFDSSTIESPNSIQTTPNVQQTPQLQSGIERALANADVKVKLEELKLQLDNAQNTQNKMSLVTEISNKDSSEEVLTLLETELNLEEQNINTERSNLPVLDITNLSEEKIQELRSEIDTKTAELRERSLQLQQAKNAILASRLKQSVSENKKGVLTKVGDKLENLGKMLPKEWSRTAKISTVIATGAVAAYLGYKVLNWFRGKKNNNQTENNQDKPSIFANKWALAGILGIAGIGAFFGIKHFRELQKIAKQAKEQAANIVNTGKEKIEELLTQEKKWEEYGLRQEQYESAIDLYATNTPESGRKIREIFSINDTGTSPSYEKFIRDMEAKFIVYNHPQNNIDYSSYEKAKVDTELTIKDTLEYFTDWLKNNELLVAGSAVFAYKYGLIQAAINTTGTIATRGLALGNALVKFGIKSPLVSLLMVGGAAGTVFASREQLRNTMAPHTFTDLVNAASKNEPLFLDASTKEPVQNITTNTLSNVSSDIVELAKYTTNLSAMIAEESTKILATLANSAYEIAGTTKEKEVFSENQKSINNVHSYLAHIEEITRRENIENNPKYQLISDAKNALIIYEKIFLEERNGNAFSPTQASQEALEELKQKFAPLNLLVESIDGIIVVKNKENNDEVNLSIDPTITDVQVALEKSSLVNSEAIFIEHALDGMLQNIRLAQGENQDGASYESLGLEGVPGMIVGNMLYVLNPENLQEYAVYSFNTGKELMQLIEGDGNSNKLGSDIGKLYGSSIMLSFSIATINKLRTLAVPSYTKSIPGHKTFSVIKSIVSAPIMPVQKLVIEPIMKYWNMGQILKAEGSFFSALRMNAILYAAKVNPHWPSMIESGNIEQLQKVIKGMRISANDTIHDMIKSGKISEAQKVLEHRFIDLVNEVDKHQLFFRSQNVADGAAFYTKLCTNNTLSSADEVAEATSDAANTADDLTEIVKSIDTAEGLDDATKALLKSDPELARTFASAMDDLSDTAKIQYIDAISQMSKNNALTLDAIQNIEAAIITGNTDAITAMIKNTSVISDVADTATDAKLLAQIEALKNNSSIIKLAEQSGKNVDEVIELLQKTNQLDIDTLVKIQQSTRAQRLLVGALKATDPAAEVTRVLKAANLARNFRVGLNMVGAAGDVFGLYMCIADYAENEGKINSTTNPTLQAMYATARPIIIADGAVSIVGLAIGGTAIYTSVATGTSLLTALGAAGGWVMAPVGLAVIGTRIVHGQLVESVEYHSATHADLKKLPPGQLLADIHNTSNGRLNFGQTFAEWIHWDSNDNYKPEDANNMARYERYRAYFSQIALQAVPAVSVLDLEPENIRNASPEDLQRMLKAKQIDNYSTFAQQAIAYICKETNKQYSAVSPEVLHDAQLFAEMRIENGTIGAGSNDVEWNEAKTSIYKREHEQDTNVATYMDEARTSATEPDKFSAEFGPVIIAKIQHDMAHCEQRILDDIYWESSEALIRGYVTHEMWSIIKHSHDILRSKQTIEATDIEVTIKDLKALLAKSPAQLYKEASEVSYKTYLENIGTNTNRLSVYGARDYLEMYALHAPKNAGTETNPVSLKTIHYYHNNIQKLDMEQSGAYFSNYEEYYGRPVGSNNPPFKITSHISNDAKWEFWYSPNAKPDATTPPSFTVELAYKQVEERQ